jgi:hypothetical protein
LLFKKGDKERGETIATWELVSGLQSSHADQSVTLNGREAAERGRG